MVKVSIIIVKYKAPELLKRCLASIPKRVDYEVIVVNNDIINRGFAKGVNYGVKQAKGKYILLLNPDCVLKPRTIETLVKVMDSHPEIGIAGPQLVDQEGKAYLSFTRQPTKISAPIIYSVVSKWFPRNKYTWAYWYKGQSLNKSREVESISGAAMLIRRREYLDIDKLDERFFMYWEDYDLCWRFREQHQKIWYEAKAQLIHTKEGSTQRESYQIKQWFRQSRRRFFNKHFGLVYGTMLAFWLWATEEWQMTLILLAAAILRFYKLPDLMPFLGDQGRDFLAAAAAVKQHSLPLLGIESSVPRFAQGPLYVWGLMILMALGLTDPVWAGLISAGIGWATVLLLYLLIYKYFSRRTAILASLILATAPLAVTQSRLTFMTNPIPLVSLWYLNNLFKPYTQLKQWFWLGFSFALLFQFELAIFPLALLIGWYGVTNRKKIKNVGKAVGLTLLGISTGLLPQVIYDVSHQFRQLTLFLIWVGYRLAAFVGMDQEHTISPARLNSFLTQITTYILRFFAWEHPDLMILYGGLIVGAVVMGYLRWRQKKLDNPLIVIWGWVLTLMAGFMVHSAPSEAYFPVLFVPLCVLVAWAADNLPQKWDRAAVALLVLGACINMVNLFRFDWFMTTPRNVQLNKSFPYGTPLKQQKVLVEKIKTEYKVQKINLIWNDPTLKVPHFTDSYIYLSQIAGLTQTPEGEVIKIGLDQSSQPVIFDHKI